MTHEEIIQSLLIGRGLDTPDKINEFFHPLHPKDISSPFDSSPAIQLIKQHIDSQNQIAIIGDYDVDGVCSTAILWETLHRTSKLVSPFIPHRRIDGYGLSEGIIQKVVSSGAKLIIAVDCGITAISAVDQARSLGCDVIIIDHHERLPELPNANVILHSTVTCATALAWFFCRDFNGDTSRLELVSLAVICDMISLIGINRSFAKFGLAELNSTSRIGLKALFAVAGLDPTQKPLGTYEVGFLIGPRLNAMGRLDHALDSLRLLCTTDPQKAEGLAISLQDTNKERQDLTLEAVNHALAQVDPSSLPNLIIVSDPSYDEGIIGLVAAKLVEKFHRPAIVFNRGTDTSKGSARSIPGFNIIDHLRLSSELFTSVGGHAMAAGMTIPTVRIPEIPLPDIDSSLLVKKHRFDLEVSLGVVDLNLYLKLSDFAPFGLGNPQPVFKSVDVPIQNPKKIGRELQHLKFKAGDLDAVYFNAPESISGQLIYSLDLNTWNGKTSLQLIVRHSEV